MDTLRVTPLLSAAICLSLACSGDGTGPSGPSWSQRAPLPVPRTDHRVVTVGGKAYALGGFSGSTLARVDEYDPATNTWTRKADMPTARRNFAAGVIDGKIYVSAGMAFTDPNGVTYIAATDVYDPVADTWASRAPCPLDPATNNVFGNVSITGGVANGHLYVMVFNTTILGFTKTHEYDPGTDSWTTKAPPPFSYQQYAMSALGANTLFLFASEGGPATQVAEYNAVDDIWIIREGISGRWWSGVGAANGKLYAAGGVAVGGNSTPTDVVESVGEYDAASDQWISRAGLGSARHSAGVVELGGKLYVIGGSTSANYFTPSPVATVEEGTFPTP